MLLFYCMCCEYMYSVYYNVAPCITEIYNKLFIVIVCFGLYRNQFQ